MHPTFGEFLDDCSSIKPTPQDFQFAHDLAKAMAGYYPNEFDRLTDFASVFETRALSLHGIALKSNTTDFTLTAGRYMVLNVEGKKEPGTSGNVFIQNLGYYASHLKKSPELLQCRNPAFLLSLEGAPPGVGSLDMADIYIC